jgi:hypothetical protein
MFGIVLVQKPYKGCLVHLSWFAVVRGRGLAEADRHSGAPADVLLGYFCEARERRLGETLTKASAEMP